MSESKIMLAYRNDEGSVNIESVWATKEGEFYRINNIPFFTSNIALNDLIKAKENNGALYYDDLVEASGHSTVQIVFLQKDALKGVTEQLEKFGCGWEGSHLKYLISVDIPANVDYAPIKSYLVNAEEQEVLSYKEACLEHKY
ncbi:hypothetical protein HNQ91_004310 [Filimonas zeae]|uniref:DUF4265 domain-containing protein n=1 Tax=Filimonas zeae TaxID=1737353 RepID=A0A917J386_9BACT|nr:DUF4265 domain-containing protein [Filimonas zeae]MDR6341237.1 hypothetical protein [Filimonas zeae]GGH76679.1 hypothetical protein GCM10011379_41880 [Filimonas zeae]